MDSGDGIAESKPSAGALVRLPLACLLLNPANPRLAGQPDRADPASLLARLGRDALHRISVSLRTFGWLDVEPIVVEPVDGGYLVVDGNLRVVALREVLGQAGEPSSLGRDVEEGVLCWVNGDGSSADAALVGALRHISQREVWSALGIAEVLEELRGRYGDRRLAPVLSRSTASLNSHIDALHLFRAFGRVGMSDREPDSVFDVCMAIAGSRGIRDWLGWSREGWDEAAVDRLVGWMSVSEAGEFGDLESRGEAFTELDGAIRLLDKADVARLERQLQREGFGQGTRQLSLFPNDFRSDWIVQRSVERLEYEILRLRRYRSGFDRRDVRRLRAVSRTLELVVAAQEDREPEFSTSSAPWPLAGRTGGAVLENVAIRSFRGLREVLIQDLGRINLFAGVNNAGKTSVLEAIYALVHQADSRALLELARRRVRRERLPDGHWLRLLIPDVGKIEGTLEGAMGVATSVEWQQSLERDSSVNVADFLGTLRLVGTLEGHEYESVTTIFETQAPTIKAPGAARILCRAIFTSPFSLSDTDVLERANEDATILGIKEGVIEFLKAHLCPGLEHIELVSSRGRFLVTESGCTRDLASYGQGMQRVFLLGMLVGLARDGILLIDEFENAVHVGLLAPMAMFLRDLAREHNVQIFLTTHSQEAIEAWTQPDLAADVVGYALRGDQPVARIEGPRLANLIEAIGLDLRNSR